MSSSHRVAGSTDEAARHDRRPASPQPLIVRIDGRPPRRRSAPAKVAIAIGVAMLTAATGYAVEAARDGGDILGPGLVRVEVGIERSAFDLGSLRVREGTTLELVVTNDDPIDHELVIGDAAVHERHADGTERRHPPVPGEVSVAPGDTAMTFYRFDEPGTVVYACHLPGHVQYGMVGKIEVVPA